MKVTRYICDRCGREVLQIQRTLVEIRDMGSGQTVDLCPECTEALDAWLETGAKDVADSVLDEIIANKKDGG